MRLSFGYTLFELILTIALVAIATGMWSHVDRGDLVHASRGLVRSLISTRYHAAATGLTAFVLGNCAAVQPPADGVAIVMPPRGLLFTPDGLPRTCDGGGVGNTTILLEHRGRQAAVIVSSLGRVRWELR